MKILMLPLLIVVFYCYKIVFIFHAMCFKMFNRFGRIRTFLIGIQEVLCYPIVLIIVLGREKRQLKFTFIPPFH